MRRFLALAIAFPLLNGCGAHTYGHHGYHHDSTGEVLLLGGLIVGAAIASSAHEHHHEYDEPRTIVVSHTVYVHDGAPPGAYEAGNLPPRERYEGAPLPAFDIGGARTALH